MPVLLANIRLARKNICKGQTLQLFAEASVTKRKRFWHWHLGLMLWNFLRLCSR